MNSSVTVTVMDAEAVLEGVAKLPCDLSLPIPSDLITLVIWYKGGTRTPIYRYELLLFPFFNLLLCTEICSIWYVTVEVFVIC